MKKVFNTPDAPAPIGPYNQAVILNDTIFVSGQIALDPSSGNLVQESIQSETHQVMKNLQAILVAAGYDWQDVVKCSIFVKDMANFQNINEVYGSYFQENAPARETVEVSALPKNVNVEISLIAGK